MMIIMKINKQTCSNNKTLLSLLCSEHDVFFLMMLKIYNSIFAKCFLTKLCFIEYILLGWSFVFHLVFVLFVCGWHGKVIHKTTKINLIAISMMMFTCEITLLFKLIKISYIKFLVGACLIKNYVVVLMLECSKYQFVLICIQH
jgi:hypothetical protein